MKTFKFALIAAAALSISACGSEDAQTSEEGSEDITVSETVLDDVDETEGTISDAMINTEGLDENNAPVEDAVEEGNEDSTDEDSETKESE